MRRQFSSTTDCPACFCLAVHWMRAPAKGKQVHVTMKYRCIDTTVWGNNTVTQNTNTKTRIVKTDPETAWTVIRECIQCGEIWGEE